jgi:hypothetical protein
MGNNQVIIDSSVDRKITEELRSELLNEDSIQVISSSDDLEQSVDDLPTDVKSVADVEDDDLLERDLELKQHNFDTVVDTDEFFAGYESGDITTISTSAVTLHKPAELADKLIEDGVSQDGTAIDLRLITLFNVVYSEKTDDALFVCDQCSQEIDDEEFSKDFIEAYSKHTSSNLAQLVANLCLDSVGSHNSPITGFLTEIALTAVSRNSREIASELLSQNAAKLNSLDSFDYQINNNGKIMLKDCDH